jgi:hypothetical protein
MYSFRSVLRKGLLTCFVAASLFSVAQTHSFHFFPVRGLSFATGRFIGKIDSHFFIINRKPGLDLSVYDTVSQTVVNRSYQFPRYLIRTLFYKKSVAFIGLTADSSRMTCHFLELDERGDVLDSNHVRLPLLNVSLQAITSADQNHTLIYQYIKKGNDSAFVQGGISSRKSFSTIMAIPMYWYSISTITTGCLPTSRWSAYHLQKDQRYMKHLYWKR